METLTLAKGGDMMKKTILILVVVILLALTATGCKKGDRNPIRLDTGIPSALSRF